MAQKPARKQKKAPRKVPAGTPQSQVSTFRLASDSRAQLAVITTILNTSTAVSAIQLAIRFLYERLEEIAPRSATPERIEKLYREELSKQTKS